MEVQIQDVQIVKQEQHQELEQAVAIIVDQENIPPLTRQQLVDRVDQENIHQEQQIQDVQLV